MNQPACPQCTAPMEALALEGHYGAPVQTDLCGHCNLLWLDEFESSRLSGLGWVKLLRRMQAATLEPTGAWRTEIDCARCRSPLRAVHNQSKIGRFAELECPRCHGRLASFSLLLAQRGVVRPLTRRDLDALQKERRQPCCLNCGAGLTREQCAGQNDTRADCPYCRSPLLVIDMPRFLSALLTRHAEALPVDAVRHIGWDCRACGAAAEPTHSAACTSCGHAVVVPSFLDLRPVLDAVEPLLKQAQGRGPRAHNARTRSRLGDPSETALYRYWLRLRNWFS